MSLPAPRFNQQPNAARLWSRRSCRSVSNNIGIDVATVVSTRHQRRWSRFVVSFGTSGILIALLLRSKDREVQDQREADCKYFKLWEHAMLNS